MDNKIYIRMSELEREHWWFIARGRIIDNLICKMSLKKNAVILDAGCGTGGNLRMLTCHGSVYGMDVNDKALNYSKKVAGANIQYGKLPDEIPFGDLQFDIVLLTDILEHLDNDTHALKALFNRLKVDGWLLITVPAIPFLWSQHDNIHHHKRRYTKLSLTALVESAGYTVHYISYFNFLLFPIIAAIKILRQRTSSKDYKDLKMPPTWLNSLLKKIFLFERHFIGRVSFPIGVSLLLLARRKK